MIYHRIYNQYFHAVEMLVRRLLHSPKSKDNATERAISKLPIHDRFRKLLRVFVETHLHDIIHSNGDMPYLADDVLADYPMSLPERRWLKAVSLDPRVQLFDVDWSGLDGVEPMYEPDDIFYFDQQNTSDPWSDPTYIRNFRRILEAFHQGRQLFISWINRNGDLDHAVCTPELLEYDRYEDKMRLMARADDRLIAIVLGRVQSCEYCDDENDDATELHTDRILPEENHLQAMQEARDSVRRDEDAVMPVLALRITDVHQVLERTLAIFGHYQKKDFVCEEGNRYDLEIYLDPYDEPDDIVDAVLSLGPYVELLGPQDFVASLESRFAQQSWDDADALTTQP